MNTTYPNKSSYTGFFRDQQKDFICEGVKGVKVCGIHGKGPHGTRRCVECRKIHKALPGRKKN